MPAGLTKKATGTSLNSGTDGFINVGSGSVGSSMSDSVASASVGVTAYTPAPPSSGETAFTGTLGYYDGGVRSGDDDGGIAFIFNASLASKPAGAFQILYTAAPDNEYGYYSGELANLDGLDPVWLQNGSGKYTGVYYEGSLGMALNDAGASFEVKYTAAASDAYASYDKTFTHADLTDLAPESGDALSALFQQGPEADNFRWACFRHAW